MCLRGFRFPWLVSAGVKVSVSVQHCDPSSLGGKFVSHDPLTKTSMLRLCITADAQGSHRHSSVCPQYQSSHPLTSQYGISPRWEGPSDRAILGNDLLRRAIITY